MNDTQEGQGPTVHDHSDDQNEEQTDQTTDMDEVTNEDMLEEQVLVPKTEADALCAQLREQLEEARAEAESNLDQWRRALAEFSNYKKRAERENLEFQKYAASNVIKKLLPVVDDLDRAFDELPEELQGNAWVSGIRLVRQKLMAVLEGEGVEPIGLDGGRFDPTLHEAITHEESSEHRDGEIIDVVRKGYRIGDRILRPAQVRVAR